MRAWCIVADGTDEAAEKLARVLTNDPGTGVMRHADAGYEIAIDHAHATGMNLPMVGGTSRSYVMSHAPSVENTANPSRRVALRALLILVAITVVLAAATAVYLFTRPTPYSGNWVGPGNFQGSGDPYAIEMYLSLEQKPFGGISGTGNALCRYR